MLKYFRFNCQLTFKFLDHFASINTIEHIIVIYYFEEIAGAYFPVEKGRVDVMCDTVKVFSWKPH